MAKFEYKDGCLLCNQCGRLYEKTEPDNSTLVECPCGNSETLDAIDRVMDLYNGPADVASLEEATKE